MTDPDKRYIADEPLSPGDMVVHTTIGHVRALRVKDFGKAPLEIWIGDGRITDNKATWKAA